MTRPENIQAIREALEDACNFAKLDLKYVSSDCDCEHCRLRKTMQVSVGIAFAALDELAAQDATVCEWRYDGREDDYWTTTCGLDWCLEAGTPKENGYKFCPQCGRQIKFVEMTEEQGEEEV
jgi:hypothetical protein